MTVYQPIVCSTPLRQLTAVLSVHNDIIRTIDNGQVSLQNLSATFDTVDYSILLSVLSCLFSVINTAFSWYQSFLSDRTQSSNTVFRLCRSADINFPVHCSVPQRSVLNPVEFTVYTEDITKLLIRHETKSHLYADDTQLYASCRSKDLMQYRRICLNV